MVLIEINTSWLCLQIYAKLVHHEKLAETFVTYLDCPTLLQGVKYYSHVKTKVFAVFHCVSSLRFVVWSFMFS